MVLDSNTICSWAMGACNLWSLADGSLKKELRVNSALLHFVDLGIRLTNDGQQQHLLALLNDDGLMTVWDINSSQVVMVFEPKQFTESHPDSGWRTHKVIILHNLEAMILSIGHNLTRVELNPTSDSPVSELFDGNFERLEEILDKHTLERASQKPWIALRVDMLELRDGTICAVRDRIILILSRRGGCLNVYGLLLQARIASLVELRNGSVAFGLSDGRIVTLNRTTSRYY